VKAGGIAGRAHPLLVEHASAGNAAQQERPASKRKLALHFARDVLRMHGIDADVRHMSKPTVSSIA
ncbi:MAG TPA: hypothetical protein VF956_06035, partial [Candidatus Dormibacteraeota bacterium]